MMEIYDNLVCIIQGIMQNPSTNYTRDYAEPSASNTKKAMNPSITNNTRDK
jgi:hypothetical protein